MIRWLLVACLLIAPVPAVSTPILLQGFDPERFSRKDRAIIQLALAFTGDYHGNADGNWNDASERALIDFVLRRFPSQTDKLTLLNGHVAPLGWLIREYRERLDWRRFRASPALPGFHAPWAILDRPPRIEGDRAILENDAGDLAIIISRSDRGAARDLHQRYESAIADAAPRVEIRRDAALMVTSGFTREGDAFHLVSQPRQREWINLAIIAAPYRADLVPAIRSTIVFGSADVSFELDEPSLLGTLTNLSTAFASSTSGDYQLPEIRGSGTAWFVSDRQLVTAAHVVNDCARVTDSDGDELIVEHLDIRRDLALLSSPIRSRAWLPVATEDRPGLGSRIRVLSYPYYALASTSLVVTSGDIASLQGLFNDDDQFVLSAPIQPGGSGGPGVNEQGAVVTIVLSRLSDTEMRRLTGAFSENFNFGISTSELRRWLQEVGVNPDDPLPVSFPTNDIPAHAARAVIPILCLRASEARGRL